MNENCRRENQRVKWHTLTYHYIKNQIGRIRKECKKKRIAEKKRDFFLGSEILFCFMTQRLEHFVFFIFVDVS